MYLEYDLVLSNHRRSIKSEFVFARFPNSFVAGLLWHDTQQSHAYDLHIVVIFVWHSLFGKTNCNKVVQAGASTGCSSNLCNMQSGQLRLFPYAEIL